MNGFTIDLIIVSGIILLFNWYNLYELGTIMKFRIVEKHDGEDFYYIIEQSNWGRWKRSSEYLLHLPFLSCKDAETALEKWHLRMTTNNIIMERTL
jgi:hypothetical protein